MAGYIQTYLERDVRQMVNVGNLNTFSSLFTADGRPDRQILNMSDLAPGTWECPHH